MRTQARSTLTRSVIAAFVVFLGAGIAYAAGTAGSNVMALNCFVTAGSVGTGGTPLSYVYPAVANTTLLCELRPEDGILLDTATAHYYDNSATYDIDINAFKRATDSSSGTKLCEFPVTNTASSSWKVTTASCGGGHTVDNDMYVYWFTVDFGGASGSSSLRLISAGITE